MKPLSCKSLLPTLLYVSLLTQLGYKSTTDSLEDDPFEETEANPVEDSNAESMELQVEPVNMNEADEEEDDALNNETDDFKL
jgi:hypothetical protein